MALASTYDDACRRIAPVRAQALRLLDPRPGETVIDIACGTGQSTVMLGRCAGAAVSVIGIEQCPAMAAEAQAAVARAGLGNVRIDVAEVAAWAPPPYADAMLLSYTHDVLQDPRAIRSLQRMARPGCRYVLAGMHTLPWSWGWPVNLFVMWRARRYMTTFRGLARPWHLLQAVSSEFRVLATRHAGTSYLAVGRFR
jgi:ubiquinone/menaquinone biosynthesis C-methylase UbiE